MLKRLVSLIALVTTSTQLAQAAFIPNRQTISLPDEVPSYYMNRPGIVTSMEPILPEKETHPSMWFSAGYEETLRNKKDQDATARAFWDKLVNHRYLTMEIPASIPTVKDTKTIIHKYYGDISQIAMYNAFFYRLSEDADAKKNHLDRAVAALLRMWDGPVYDLDPTAQSGPVDEIYRALWSQNTSAAYDWVHDGLTKKEDTQIRERLAKEAEVTFDELYRWGPGVHNHVSKPAWGLGSLALAISDHPDASKWLKRALTAANFNTRYFFTADGIYREGQFYHTFSLINYFPFAVHYQNVSGVEHIKEYRNAFEWPVKVRNGKGWVPNIEDSFLEPFPGHWLAPFVTDLDSDLHSSASLANVLMWNFQNTDFSPFDASEVRTGYNYTGASFDWPMELMNYFTYSPDIEPIAPDLSPTVFMEGGQSTFRSDWNFNDPQTRTLLFHGVAEADNHEHYDNLSFIIHAENQMMASDSGYTRTGYGNLERGLWYHTANAHNTVTQNGFHPLDFEANEPARSKYRLDTDFFDFEQKSAPFATGSIIKRSIAFPRERYFVIIDNIKGPKGSNIQFNFHGGRGTSSGTGSHRQWRYSDDAYGPASKLDVWFIGENFTLTDEIGAITYIKGDWARYPWTHANIIAKKANFMMIAIPGGTKAVSPKVENLSSGGKPMAKVTSDDGTDWYLNQASSSNTDLGSFNTNATFAWIGLDPEGALDGIALRESTILANGDTTLLESENRISLCFSAKSNTIDISDEAKGQVSISWPALKKKQALYLSGEKVKTKYKNGLLSFDATGGGLFTVQ